MSEALQSVPASSAEDNAGQRLAPAPLSWWRRIDWRFLLPADIQSAGYVGAVAPEELRVLRESGVRVDTSPAQDGQLEAVLVSVPENECVGAAAAAVCSGGWVLLRLGTARDRPWSRLGAGSVRTWERRLQAEGISPVGAYWHAPEEQRCSFIVDLADRRAVATLLRRYHGVRLGLLKSLVARAINRAGLGRVLARDVTLIGQRPADLSRTADAPSDLSKSGRLFVTPWFEASRHVVCLYLDPSTGELEAVAKLPRRSSDVSGINHEAAVLRDLARRTTDLAERVPSVRELAGGTRPYLLETALRGAAAGPEVVRAETGTLLNAGLQFIQSLPETGTTTTASSWFPELLERPLQAVRGLLPGQENESLPAQTLALLEVLRPARMPLVFEHGDLSHPNLLLTPDGQLGAIDWERSHVRGLPVHDLGFFLQYVSESSRRAFEPAAQLRAFDDAFTGSDAWAGPWLRRYAAGLGIDEQLLPALILATFARSSAGLLARLRPDSFRGGCSSGMSDSDLTAAFAVDRDFLLWRHAIHRFNRLLQ